MSATGTSRPRHSHLARSVWAVIAASVLIAGCSPGHPSAPASSGTTPTSIQARLAAGIDHEMALYTPYDRIRAILVQANGRTVFERYYRSTPIEYHNIASVTKSVISTLVGIAVGDGRLRLDQPLAQLLPSYASTMTPRVAHTTLQQVLTMTAGFAGSFHPAGDLDFATSPDWVRAILTHPDRPPGGSFVYSSGDSHLLSAILTTATGISVLDYARAKLFDPLDIPTRPALQPLFDARNLDAYNTAGFAWPVDPQGRQLGFGFLKLRPRDMAKIGSLYLNEGRWQGRQILPAAWIRDATIAHVTAADGATANYGYQWWVSTAAGDPAYLAWGFGGQLIEVVPRRHLVVVISTYYDLTDPSAHGVYPDGLTGLVDTVIAPALPP